MLKHVFVPSIKHTGTHVLLDGVLNRRVLMRQPRFKLHHMHPDMDRRPPPDPFLTVSPLRHPRRVAETWKRYNLRAEKYEPGSFEKMWDDFIERFAPTVDLYLHVDDPRIRERQVFLIGKWLDLALRCRWDQRFASVNNTINISLDACPDVPDRFIEFYESCKKV